MRRAVLGWVSGFAACVFLLPAATAAARDLAGFPLRVHVFQTSEAVHSRRDVVQNVEGTGRANLFENREPRGFDYSFNCSQRVMTSSGFETYPARWKKKDQVLEIALPVMGKPNAAQTCELKVLMKDFAYFKRGGAVATEPRAAFKDWMVKHGYDPEHGKETPSVTAPSGSGTHR